MSRIGLVIALVLVGVVCSWIGFQMGQRYEAGDEGQFPVPFVDTAEKPLLQYSITNLAKREYKTSKINVEEVLADHATFTSYLFSYTTLDKRMTGQLNVPKNLTTATPPTIVMLRGYVPPATYQTGIGTRNAAAFYADKGYVTLAPDFFGHGGSDPEPKDEWQARFEKPIVVIELLKTLQSTDIEIDPTSIKAKKVTELPKGKQSFKAGGIGLWGHSNGGQIALTTLEILGEPIPTTLWAPVTAPFPYSILFFSDEVEDEGKQMRKWLSIFEKDYDVFEFTLTKHLDRLQAPLQLHHGTADDAALVAWSNEFVDKIKVENKRREAEKEKTQTASSSAQVVDSVQRIWLEPIDVSYFTYPGADHNLQPGWNTVVERDIEFFQKHL